MKIRFLIASEGGNRDLAGAFDRAFSYLADFATWEVEEIDFEPQAIATAYAKIDECDVLLIAETADSAYGKGIDILRTYWADLLKRNSESASLEKDKENMVKNQELLSKIEADYAIRNADLNQMMVSAGSTPSGGQIRKIKRAKNSLVEMAGEIDKLKTALKDADEKNSAKAAPKVTESPQIIFVSFNKLQKLIGADLRNLTLCAAGINFVEVPFELAEIIHKVEQSGERIGLEVIREILKKSSDLRLDGLVGHAHKNFLGSYLLLSGAVIAGDVGKDAIENARTKLTDQNAANELDIFNAILSDGSASKQPSFKNIYKKKVLLIDDEGEHSGWKGTLSAIFDNPVDTISGPDIQPGEREKKWENFEEIVNTSQINNLLTGVHTGLNNYDLIFLDLYLTIDDTKKAPIDGVKSDLRYSGLELLEKIRSQDATVPVILFTASNKAFNIQVAQRLGIAGYFQKEAHYRDRDEVKQYYLGFKHLVEDSLDWKKMAVRKLYQHFAEYKLRTQKAISPDIRIPYEKRKKLTDAKLTAFTQDIEKILAKTLFILTVFLKIDMFLEKDVESSLLISPGVELGRAIDELRNLTGNGLCACGYAPLYIAIKGRPQAQPTTEELACSFARQIRHSAAHQGGAPPCFEDIYFMLLVLFKALQVNVDSGVYIEHESQSIETAYEAAEEMIDSVCVNSCPMNMNCSPCTFYSELDSKGSACRGFDESDVLDRARCLSTHHNLKTLEALSNNNFFIYLFFLISLRRIRCDKDFFKALSPLLQSRLGGIPFADGYWRGRFDSEGNLMTPLGKLPKDAEKFIIKDPADARSVFITDPAVVEFMPGKHYLV